MNDDHGGNGEGKRRYICSGCRVETKFLELGEPDAVRTGCPMCDTITRYVAYHTEAFHSIHRGGQA